MNKIYSFEKLAKLAIKRKVEESLGLMRGFEFKTRFFETDYQGKGEHGPTVTVWVEFETDYPRYWDLIPVVVTYKGHRLYISDICDRTQQYCVQSLKKFMKRVMTKIEEDESIDV